MLQDVVRMGWRMVWVVLSVLLAGCGAAQSAGGGGGVPEFPSRARLAEIAGQPLPRSSGQRPTVTVDNWDMNPLPVAASPENDTLRASAASRRVRTTLELTCGAREIARFYAQKGGLPDQQLQSHVLGQCGDYHPSHSIELWSVDLAGAADDAGLLAQLRAPIAERAKQWPEHAIDAGAALVRENGKAVFAAVVARRYATLAAFSPVSSDGNFVLSGTLLDRAAAVYGLSTSGPYGVSPCKFDPSLRLPQFRMACRLNDGDESAWIDLQLLEPERVLTRSALRVLVRRSPEPKPYVAPPSDPSAPAADVPTFRQNLLLAINRLRAQAGLRELVFEEQQSREHEKLAPHFFSSGDQSSYLDDIALGLMAGWEVRGLIRQGSFYGVELSGTLSAERWVAYLLEYPGARDLIFDSEARTLALGTMVDKQTATLGALISTYEFFENDDHQPDAQRLVAMVARARAARQVAAPVVQQEPALAAAAVKIRAGSDAGAALQEAMQEVAQNTHGQVQGMLIETLTMDLLQLPEELVRKPSLTYSVAVTHVRHKGAAWANLVVLIVVSQPPTTNASLSPNPRG